MPPLPPSPTSLDVRPPTFKKRLSVYKHDDAGFLLDPLTFLGARQISWKLGLGHFSTEEEEEEETSLKPGVTFRTVNTGRHTELLYCLPAGV